MEEKRDKRRRILEAAAVVFSQKGFHQARVEEIAIKAGIGKGTVYEYFSSKLELFQEMFNAVLGRYFEELHEQQDEEGTIAQQLGRILELHLNFVQKNAHFARVTFVDSLGLDKELEKWMFQQRREKVERVRELFEQGIARGEFREVNAALLADVFAGVASAMIIPVVMEGKEVDARRVATEAMDILLRGIRRGSAD